MISQAELDKFYESIVIDVRRRGGVCAITSGMACVKYGVAQSTKDCDLLFAKEQSLEFLQLLCETQFHEVACTYRGNLSPPLDGRWLSGGWTSHFQWKHPEVVVHLDVFGLAPRGSVPWEYEINGLYVSRQIVAEMKRTNRLKDWPFATALGTHVLLEGDPRGWLHIFDEQILLDMAQNRECPSEIFNRRPVLRLVLERSPLLKQALYIEQFFWHELDRIRIQIYEQAVRPYRSAVMRRQLRFEGNLLLQHQARIECAEELLSRNPVKEYGIEKIIDKSLDATRAFGQKWMEYLPDVRENFENLF